MLRKIKFALILAAIIMITACGKSDKWGNAVFVR